MLAILIISGAITPAFAWCLLYFNITDQYNEDGDMIKTKAEAQSDVFSQTVKSPFFWVYMFYVNALTFAVMCSVNAFGMGDWYFSL